MPYKDPKVRRAYHRKYRKLYYQKNKVKETLQRRKWRKNMKEWFDNYKSSLYCSQCAENTSVCLDFHHIDPNTKDFNLGVAIRSGYGKSRILEEISKCIVLCANCHRKKHALERFQMIVGSNPT